ncbi:MAG: hypothetical protein ACRBHB_17105 [Arenicella sp.]
MSSLVTHAIASKVRHPTNKLLLVVIVESLGGANSGAFKLQRLCELCSVHEVLIIGHLTSLQSMGFISFRTELKDEGEVVVIDITNWKFTLPGGLRVLH